MKLNLNLKHAVLYGFIAVISVVFYIAFGHHLSRILESIVMDTGVKLTAPLMYMSAFFVLFILTDKLYSLYTKIVANKSIELKANQLIDRIDVKTQRESESLINALLVHLESYRPYETSFVPTIIKTMVKVTLIIAALFFIDGFAASILLFTAPFIPLYYVLVGLQTQEESVKQATRFDNIGTLFLNLIRGKDTVKNTDSKETVINRLEDDNKDFVKETMHILKYAFQSTMMLEFITILGIGLVALEVALRIIIFENISFYTAFFVLLLAPEFYNALKVLGTEFHNGKLALGSFEKAQNIIDKPKMNTSYRGHTDHYSAEAENLTVGHDGKVLLNNADFTFDKTGLTAITGESGAGKTTLLRTLLGLHEPVSGQLNVLTTDIGYVSDQVYFSDTTIYEYVSAKNHSEDKVNDVLNRLNLFNSIDNLEHGIHTPIVNHDIPLSGGEIVRLKMARVLINKPAVIIMDEPTEFLDAETEQLVMKYLTELKETSAIIAVIHRRQLLSIADSHYVMDNGELKRGDAV
ncbi:ATP-binding/permease protein CydD [Jeotgalicoccus saudimassiliensis]|uniref:ATP-binding/permease protein CydD n=1 Tax=Jeotgalicoccus saudimassiliensis TaxID=1461582 RepID=A0A078M2B0_9STAP|nr:ATP-binding cassette domain-containing protein [Jeotgalicoccus saudimassiliensis]CDZ98976.1 ATP-binding/permease protein CydD [Jeotgalicoccus saudimassiliensis]